MKFSFRKTIVGLSLLAVGSTFIPFQALALLPAGTYCAAYTDVSKTDPDCDAFTYMKSLGALTGNPDGTLEPSGVLQRDQVAKIVLATFALYENTANYCTSGDPFLDVHSSAWSYQYICRAKALGLVTGYKSAPDAGTYRPARSINRVEFLAILLRNLKNVPDQGAVSGYTDVLTDAWYSGFAKYSYDNSLFAGTRLYPVQDVTRREVAQIIYKLHLAGKF